MKLIFCRHGQTEFNLADKFQGVSDSPLTNEGIEKAKLINKFIKSNFQISDFYLSPAPRVKQTYDIVSENITANLYYDDRLKEVCYGDWEEKRREDLDQNLLKIREKDRFNFIHPGIYKGVKGESYMQQFLRLKPFLDEITSKIDLKDKVIISHHGIMISILKYFNFLKDEDLNSARIANNKIIIVEIEEKCIFKVEIKEFE